RGPERMMQPLSPQHAPLRPPRLASLVLAVLTVLASAVLACGGGDVATKVEDPFSGGYPTYRDEESGITAILGTPDLGVGTFRVAIALSDPTGLIRFPSLTFESARPEAE